MSRNKKAKNQVVEETVMDVQVDEIDEVEETSDVVTDTVVGIVVNCVKLNIRKEDTITAKVLCEVTKGSELTVDLTKSNPDWLNVTTVDGVAGFCMAKYVSLGK